MRIVFLLGNLIALFVATILVYLNLSFRAAPPDPVLKNTPKTEEFNVQLEKTVSRGNSVDFSKLLNDNVFSSYRAKEEGDAFSSLKATGLELIGVISYGDASGAIIADKGAQQAAVQLPGNRASVLSGGNKRNMQAAGRPQFYKLNDVLPNGFILKEVHSDSVLLSRGREQLVLQLDFDDEGSKMRANEGVKVSAVSAESSKQVQDAQKRAGASGAVVIQPPQPVSNLGIPSQPSTQQGVNDSETSASQEEDAADNKTEQLKRAKKRLPRPGEIIK